MTSTDVHFWAKTTDEGLPGISVQDHCQNVGCVAEALISSLPARVRALLPEGAATLAALHDVGKITLGFQAKCPAWLASRARPSCSHGEIALSVSDHALVSQRFLQYLPGSAPNRLWAVAVGAHHGRPKGKKVRLDDPPEALSIWAEDHRLNLLTSLKASFGPLPTSVPDARFGHQYSDLWLLAGLITVADWIGSNEAWFDPKCGSPLEQARVQAFQALRQIGWPGGKLRSTDFSSAFTTGNEAGFAPNALQQAVAEAASKPGVIIVEGPMGCGKTEAALHAAQQLIVTGQQHGIYFGLPTQVTSNRIHLRIERFLRTTLETPASFRLAHGNAWLEDDFDLQIKPAYRNGGEKDVDKPTDVARDARSWFASAKQALLAPYGVGTIDQALQGVVAVKHFFVRRFALAGKVVILDEVHSYDIYTGTLITALIRELINLRCSVIVLSATLTAARRGELLAAAGVTESSVPTEYPLVTFGSGGSKSQNIKPRWDLNKRINVRPEVLMEDETIGELIRRAEAGQHVLWIRNTVVEAQQAFRVVASAICQDSVRIGLLHSRFPFARRAELEQNWLELLGPNRPISGPGSILVATQVVEQSVDIDLDFIVSDLAPTDMLLQRMGRLWRHSRPRRQAGQPDFWIRRPVLEEASTDEELVNALGRSARVYAPYVLLRTAAVWGAKTEINLPADIRPLLEATYAELGAQEPEAWGKLHAKLEEEKRQLVANAEAATLVLGRPMLQDDEAILTRRQGAPTTPLVLVRAITPSAKGRVVVTALDGEQMEISEQEWYRNSARFLHHWMVRAPRWMVPVDASRPAWLTLHGPDQVCIATVGNDGRCSFGTQLSNLTYDARLGLFAERATATPKPKDDDEFDY